MLRIVITFIVSSLLFATSGLSAQPVALQPAKDAAAWTVDDVVLAETASDMRISPAGKWVVWVKRSPDKDKNEMIGHLMLASLTETKEIQLTRGVHSSTQPRWSPDGKLIAFLSSRPVPKATKGKREDDDADDDAKTQVWLMNPFGGEPWVLTESPRDVRQTDWTGADAIVYVAQEKKTRLELTLKDKKDDVTVVDDEPNEPPVRMWRVTVKDKKSERLTDNTDRIQSLAVSPDGRWAVAIHERSLSYTFDHRIKPAVFLHDLQKKERTQVFQDARFNIAQAYWTNDSTGFYAINQFTNHPRFLMAYIEEPYYFDLAERKATRVDLKWERGLADADDGFAVTPDGFVVLLANGVRHAAQRYVRKGAAWTASKIDAAKWQEIRVAKDGKTLVYLESSAVEPPRWMRARLDGVALQAPAVLTDLQADLRKKPIAKTEVFRWKGALGENVEGLISYPHHYQRGKKYPLIVLIHGGPFWADFDHWDERWSYVRNLLCARGAFVLRPNYHGSSHYGLAWAESISNGKYYTLPVEDIEKGIDAFVARGEVEPGRVALGGWSNGAILTMSLITRRTYRAASAGAGGADWATDWGVCPFGMSFSSYYIGKAPYEDPDLYRKNAPFYDFAKVRTPTILFHGSEDTDVPAHHSWYEFRTLRELGKADVRFLVFPGAKHGLVKLSHRRRKVEEELAWFDKYLFGTHNPPNAALKDDSPLAVALAVSKAERSGKRFGATINGVLAPETVEYKGLRIGRFEVTRAQYAEFDKKYAIEAGTENFPANAIRFERAKAYCQWLAQKTGQPFRLGTRNELTPIYGAAEANGNTLDHWAGYAPNPEDRARLEATIKEIGGNAPLLKQVGSFPSADAKTAIFDLGGNVAEWADDAGTGKLLGGSADIATGERHQRAPAPAYVGFRVVLHK